MKEEKWSNSTTEHANLQKNDIYANTSSQYHAQKANISFQKHAQEAIDNIDYTHQDSKTNVCANLSNAAKIEAD